MSKAEREKGARFEREIANTFADHFGFVVQRNIGQARDGGDDITLPRANGGNIVVECKRRAKLSVEKYLLQAELACESPSDLPVVVMRGDGRKPFVLMRLEDALPLIGGEIAPTPKAEP